MKKFLGQMTAIFAVTVLALMFLGTVGHAMASTESATADPVDLAAQFLEFIKTGRGTAAVGVANMLLVWAVRSLIAPRVSWFGTRRGGYVLGISTSAIEYFGAALISGVTPTPALLFNVAGAAFAAIGGWHALRDTLAATGRTVGPTAAAALIVALGASSPGCSGAQRETLVSDARDVIDCTVDVDLAVVARLAPLVLDATRGDWDRIAAAVEPLGPRLGLCLAAEVLRVRPPSAVGEPTSESLDNLKARHGVATVRTAHGDY